MKTILQKVLTTYIDSRAWHDYIPELQIPNDAVHVDLGSGNSPRDPFKTLNLIPTDLLELKRQDVNPLILDLTRKLPFEDNSVWSFSAFDVLEHIPRWERIDNHIQIYPFVQLMSEIYRCLKPEGYFLAVTPAFPSSAVFQDPTHVNFISEETIKYFSGKKPWASELGYEFTGQFKVIKNEWLLGSAPYEGTSKLQFMQNINQPKKIIKLFLNSVRFFRFLNLVSKKFEIYPLRTHLLWVLQKSN